MSSQRFGQNYLGNNSKDDESEGSDIPNRDSSGLMPFGEINPDDIE